MIIREIQAEEVDKLLTCITGLSEYHNTVSVHFKGCYPSRPYFDTIEIFKKDLQNKKSRIAVVEDKDIIVSFCKVDIIEASGKLDYLFVLEEYRRQGLGKQLMDWAMNIFKENKVSKIEVKVIDGNEAIHFYEKYGFKMNAHILWCV